jgi:uncharacterized protein YlzI (FlbEa/FlbD family)
MIKLTRSNDRDVWVEPSAIVMVESDGMKTTVTLAHGAMLLVKESVQHVLSERLKSGSVAVAWDAIDADDLVKSPSFSGFVK